MSGEMFSMADLPRILEALSPSSLAAHLDADRPYDGQPHTDHGERGRSEVKGITFRDLRDCFIRACYESSGLPIKEWPGTVYDLPWDDMDIIAVAQNLACNVEKRMGIYPSVPRLLPVDPTLPRRRLPMTTKADLHAQIRDLLEEREELLTEIRRLQMGNHPAGRALPITDLAPHIARMDADVISLCEALEDRDAGHEGGEGA